MHRVDGHGGECTNYANDLVSTLFWRRSERVSVRACDQHDADDASGKPPKYDPIPKSRDQRVYDFSIDVLPVY